VFASRYMPCRRCGASLERSERVAHECSVERLLDYWMFAIRDEVTSFPDILHQYLDSPSGRFEAWEAARQIRQSPGRAA
jgi:hypothetical protein